MTREELFEMIEDYNNENVIVEVEDVSIYSNSDTYLDFATSCLCVRNKKGGFFIMSIYDILSYKLTIIEGRITHYHLEMENESKA